MKRVWPAMVLIALSTGVASLLAQPAPPSSAPGANTFGGRGRGGPLPAPNTDLRYQAWTPTPPMGWNSWDSYGAGVWQADVLANADYMDKNLKAHGWNTIVIDIQWYEPLAHTTEYRDGAALEVDANGRLLPAPNRFPMTAATRSFKPIADYLHARGLKFGLHLMRGIPRQAVDKDNTPILGTRYKAADIADKQNVCRWNHDMYGVNMTKPGAQEYYDSVFAQLAAWELDFVKVDDLSGQNAEISAIRKAIDKTGRPIVLSVSPGGGSNAFIASTANMWRMSGDFWDNWPALYAQFVRMNDVTPFRGPGHWPDADMLPFGNIRTWNEAQAWTKFTKDEHYTLMTLWCIGRSPLMMGGNMAKNDEFTLSIMSNDEVIAVNQNSTNNKQVFNTNNHVAWVADVPNSKDKYVALFNANPAPPPGRGGRGGRGPAAAPAAGATTAPQMAGDGFAATTNPAATNLALLQPAEVSVSLADLGITGAVKVRDLWAKKDLGLATGKISATINSHGAVLYRVSPQ